MIPDTRAVIVFDFDDVLTGSKMIPEAYYEQIPMLLECLVGKYRVCVASYNPRAKIAIESWGLLGKFDAIRCGEKVDTLDMVYDMLKQLGLKKDHIVYYYCKNRKDSDKITRVQNISVFQPSEDNGPSWEDIKFLF
jgi:hypothetical protein